MSLHLLVGSTGVMTTLSINASAGAAHAPTSFVPAALPPLTAGQNGGFTASMRRDAQGNPSAAAPTGMVVVTARSLTFSSARLCVDAAALLAGPPATTSPTLAGGGAVRAGLRRRAVAAGGGWETDPLLYSPLAGDLVSPASRLRWRRYYRATDGDGDDCPQGCAARSGVDFACHLSGFNLGHLFAFGKAAYAATYLEAPSARTLSLSLAADDNAQFWVNGGAVSGVGSATCTASAGCVARTVSVALPAGTSLLMVKVWKNAAGSASGRQQGLRRLLCSAATRSPSAPAGGWGCR